MSLHLLSAGAAKGLVDRLTPDYTRDTGLAIAGTFNAVGAIEQAVLAGAPCDVLILTAAQIDALAKSGHLLVGSAAPLGAVPTSVAVPDGHASPDISTATALAQALGAATALYVPHMQASTAGRHVAAVLRQLGLDIALADRIRMFPNGETAMAALARDSVPGALGCTQITEIRNTAGLTPIGRLPDPHALATIYTAAITTGTPTLELAQRLVALLTGPATRGIREHCGFDVVSSAV